MLVSSNSKNQYISTGKQAFLITEAVLKNLNKNLENKELKVKYAVPKQYAITDKDNIESGSYYLARNLREIIDNKLKSESVNLEHIQRQYNVFEQKLDEG